MRKKLRFRPPLAAHVFDLTGPVLSRLALLVFISFTPHRDDRFALDTWLAGHALRS